MVPKILIRNKELEQSHLCLGASSYPQNHDDRYSSYVLNTLLGGSMSSRLFQNVREKRGLAYAVFSGLSAYRDAGSFTIYAGCSNEAVGEVIDLVVEELRGIRRAPVADPELRRAKDHLKGSLMLSLENTASRMSHLARQEIYFDRQFGLDETLQGIERVTAADVQRVAADLFRNGSLAATVLGNVNGLQIPRRTTPRPPLDDDSALHPPRDGPHLERPASLRDLAARGDRRRRGDGGRRHRAGRSGARHPRARRLRHRAHRGDRADDPARRDRVYDGGGRARRAVGALAALRDDLVGRHRHRAGAADARGVRRDPGGPRRAGRGRPRPRARAPADADDRPHARRARRADDVRAEAGALVRGDRPRHRARAPRARDRSASASCRARSGRSRTCRRRSKPTSAGGSGSSRRRWPRR